MTPELSRPVPVDRLPATLMVRAEPPECAALAARLRIPSVDRLTCRFVLRRHGAVVVAEGVLEADVVQECVVSLDPVAQHVEDRFTIRFVPESPDAAADDADPDAPDEIPYTGSVIDLGEAAAEQLALALDPYPRHPDAVLDPAGTDADGPLAALLRGFKPV